MCKVYTRFQTPTLLGGTYTYVAYIREYPPPPLDDSKLINFTFQGHR